MTQPFGQLEKPVLDALRALREAFPSTRMAVIGAGALALQMDMTWRNTADVDVVLTIDIEDLDSAESKLKGFRRGSPPRWIAPNGIQLDLVPAPAAALAARQLVWPDGAVMSLAGIRVALEYRGHMASKELDIALAPVPLVAMLKMAAYLDRPHDRAKDLRDLAHIFYDYPPIDDDRLFDDAVFDAHLSQEAARGMILAREIAQLIGAEDREVVTRFIAKMREEGPAWSHFVLQSPWRYDEDRLREPFDAFCNAFASSMLPTTNPIKSVATSDAIALRFIVNGEEVAIEAGPDDQLRAAVDAALSQTHNTARPSSEWQLRRENGAIVADQSKSAREHGLASGTVLYLSLKAGAGGDAPCA